MNRLRQVLPLIAIAVFCSLAAAGAEVVCLAPGVQSGSACSAAFAGISWGRTLPPSERLPSAGDAYDPLLSDPALYSGTAASGDLPFRIAMSGSFLVEVFLVESGPRQSSYALDSGETPLDTRYVMPPAAERLRPKSGRRWFSLVAAVHAPAELTVKTVSPGYFISAVRATPFEVFERTLVPAYRARVRELWANPILGRDTWGATLRRNYLEQFYERLQFSDDPVVRREGLVGMARTGYWLAMENKEARDIARAVGYYRAALEAAPDDPLLRQTVTTHCAVLAPRAVSGPRPDFCDRVRPVPWNLDTPPDPHGAPAWAAAQRRMVRRMEAITRWWVERRQHPNGELGGGWNDDVEIIRSWAPLALGFGSKPAAEGIRRIADGLWASELLADGYNRKVTDVEHSAEPTTDTLPLRAALAPGDPAALARLEKTASCAYNWIAAQPDGKWRFRGSWFNCSEVDATPKRAIDVHLNTRAMGPALWHAYLTRDPRMITLLTRWGEAWLDAMEATVHGKPAGLFPPAMRSSDGEYLIGAKDWRRPEAEWDYFQWSGKAQEALTSLMLALHDLTGERRWIDAAARTFTVLEKCAERGEECRGVIDPPVAFLEWRRRTGDARFDNAAGFTPVTARSEVLALVEKESLAMESRLSVNFDMFTSEALFTDRVNYQLPAGYRFHLFGGEAPRGDRFPAFAVTWPETSGDFARAVVSATNQSLSAALFNFESLPIETKLRLWKLAKGKYRWELRSRAGVLRASGNLEIASHPQLASISLPPREEVFLTIGPTTPLETTKDKE